MNKLLTYPGGQPFTTGDIDFLQDCYTSIINAVVRGIAMKDCILFGITDDSQANASVYPGAVFIQGEIFIVPSEIKDINKYLCFRKVEKENRKFADSGSHNVYLTYEPYVSATTEGAYKSIEISTATKLQDVISQEESWIVPEEISFPDGVKGSVMKRRLGKRMQFYCEISKTTTSDNVLFVYPTTRLAVPFVGFAVNGDQNVPLFIVSSLGKCRCYKMDGSEYNGTFSGNFFLEKNKYEIRP